MNRRVVLGGSLLLIAAVLAACGGGDTIEVTRVVEEIVTEVQEVEVEVTKIVDGEVVVETVVEEVEVIVTADSSLVGAMATPTRSTQASGSEPGDDVTPAGEPVGTGAKVTDESTPAAEVASTPEADEPREAGDIGAESTAETEPAPISQLAAGEVDDNIQFEAFLAFLEQYAGPAAITVNVAERYRIEVVDNSGFPLLGVPVALLADGVAVGTLRTFSDGAVYFFPQALGVTTGVETYTAVATINGVSQIVEIPAGQTEPTYTIVHATSTTPALNLDILFVIDATGSMSEQIAVLKENINHIATEIDALPTAPDVRFGLIAYRDRGDEFVTSMVDLTDDLALFTNGLAEVEAAGGGDYPEDMHTALYEALLLPSWRTDNSVKLIFLLADAPPHLDYADQSFNYVTEMMNAAEQGIKIFSIAADGLNLQGEYIMRQMAQYTSGRFIFLTKDESTDVGEAGTDEGAATNVEYSVAFLDELLVAIVADELNHQLR